MSNLTNVCTETDILFIWGDSFLVLVFWRILCLHVQLTAAMLGWASLYRSTAVTINQVLLLNQENHILLIMEINPEIVTVSKHFLRQNLKNKKWFYVVLPSVTYWPTKWCNALAFPFGIFTITAGDSGWSKYIFFSLLDHFLLIWCLQLPLEFVLLLLLKLEIISNSSTVKL